MTNEPERNPKELTDLNREEVTIVEISSVYYGNLK